MRLRTRLNSEIHLPNHFSSNSVRLDNNVRHKSPKAIPSSLIHFFIGMPLSRKKSCIRCRDFKLSCDRAIPACIRCVKREARCVYDGRERERYEPYSTLSAPGLEKQLSQSPLEIEPSSINGNSDLRLGTTDTEPATDKTDISHMNWARPETYEGSTRLALESFNPSNIRIDSSLFSPCNIFSEQPFFEPLTVEAELSITSVHQKEDRSLMPEAKKCPNTRYLETRKHLADCMLTVIILGQLTSYPKLLVGGYQLPPFIKAPCHLNEELAPECAASGKHQCLPKVLAVCAGLVQMFYSSTAANVACVWDMIYAEAAKLRGEVRESNHRQPQPGFRKTSYISADPVTVPNFQRPGAP